MTACNRGPCRTYAQELVSSGVRFHPSTEAWAGQYNTWLLIELMLKGLVFSFPSCSLSTEDMSSAGAVMSRTPRKCTLYVVLHASRISRKVVGPSAIVAQHGQHAFHLKLAPWLRWSR